jgi:acyl-CoA reductase-like NAD-dependent aldehyde dehydrogenase
MPFDDEAALLKEANNSVFGLAAGIWTRDYKRAYRIARALEAGTIWINTYKVLDLDAVQRLERERHGTRKRPPGHPRIHATEESLLGA